MTNPNAGMRYCGGNPSDRNRGAVLLMILVLVVVLSAVILQFAEKGLTDIMAEGHYVQRDRMRIEAFSALEVTLAVMADVVAIEGELTAPEQGWGDPLSIAGYEPPEGTSIAISFADESGRLPLRQLDEQFLIPLFIEMGFSTDESFKLTYSLLDWVDPDDQTQIDGAESDVYSQAEWPYVASNQPVADLSELRVVDGFRDLFFDEFGRPNEYFRALEGAVSLYAGGTLNMNSVSELALRAYGGFGDPEVAALRDYRAGADGIRGTEDDRYFATRDELTAVLPVLPEGVQLGVTAGAIRVRVEVTEGDGRFALEAVVQSGQGTSGRPAGGSGAAAATAQVNYPFVFLELREDVGQNESVAEPGEEGFVESDTGPAA